MNIQKAPNYTTFGSKLNTISVLESTTCHYLNSGNKENRVKLIAKVLNMKPKELPVLNRDPIIGFICFMSSGKILSEKNPKLVPIAEKLKQIIKTDKTGENTNAFIKDIIKEFGSEIDLKI